MTDTEPIAPERQSRWADDAARLKVSTAKERLRMAGWELADGGWHGLPPFRIIEKWFKSDRVLYGFASYQALAMRCSKLQRFTALPHSVHH